MTTAPTSGPPPTRTPLPGPPTDPPTGPPREPSVISNAAEALGYGGGTLTTLAALYLFSDVWSSLLVDVQTGLLAVATLFLGGVAAIVGTDDGVARRLSTTLSLLAGITGVVTIYLAVDSVAGLGGDAGLAAAGFAAAVAGTAASWRRTDRVLSPIVLVPGAVGLFGAVGMAGGDDGFRALALWLLGAAWAVAAAAGQLGGPGPVEPTRRQRALLVNQSLGAVLAIAAAQAVLTDDATAGLVLGIITTVVLAGAAVRMADVLPTGWAVLAAAVFVPQAAMRWIPEDLRGSVGTMAVGLVMLAACGVLVTRARNRRGDVGPGAGARGAGKL